VAALPGSKHTGLLQRASRSIDLAAQALPLAAAAARGDGRQ